MTLFKISVTTLSIIILTISNIFCKCILILLGTEDKYSCEEYVIYRTPRNYEKLPFSRMYNDF